MPRILQALRNLQSQTLGPSPEADDVPSGAGAVPNQSATAPQASLGASEQTIVLQESAAKRPPQPAPPTAEGSARDEVPSAPQLQQTMPTRATESEEIAPSRPQPPSPLQNELIEKLTRQLAQALKQRDSVAQEVVQIRRTLESHDQQKEDEIDRLRHLLEGHEQAAKSIETQLKQQLQRQQEEFARKLDDFEKRFQAAPPATFSDTQPAVASSASRAPTRPPAKTPRVFQKPTVEKPIPNTSPIRAALEELAVGSRNEEISALADQLFGLADPGLLPEPLVIFLGSCHSGRGTEQTTLQLALWYSQQAAARDVLVIDGALREKSLSRQMGLRSSAGIFEVVRRESYRQDGLYLDSETGLVFLPAGRSSFLLTPNEQDALALREDLLELLKDWPVILIVGEGPELSSSRLFASLAMKTYLQVELGKVSAPEVVAAVEAYRRADIEPAGLIATHAAAGCYT